MQCIELNGKTILVTARDYGFTPKIGIREGLRAFAQWYADYY